jgi:hypothetical protein
VEATGGREHEADNRMQIPQCRSSSRDIFQTDEVGRSVTFQRSMLLAEKDPGVGGEVTM